MFKKFIEQLNNLDPMPWNQAILLGAAFGLMVLLALLGNFVA